MSSDCVSEPDVRTRIGKAASIFQRHRPVWSSTTINLNIKLRLYTAIVILTVSYACEKWKKMAMIAHARCLPSPLPTVHTILGVSWHDHATHGEVMRRADMERLQDIVTTRRRKMAGHILRLQRLRKPIQQCIGCQKTAEQREAEEDMAKYIQRRPGRDGCELAWSPHDYQ